MAFGRRQGGSSYLDQSSLQPVGSAPAEIKVSRKKSSFSAVVRSVALSLGLLVLASSLQLSLLSGSIISAAAADRPEVGESEDDGSQAVSDQIRRSMEEAGFDPSSEADMREWSKKSREPENRNSFDSLFYRLFVPQYINATPKGVSTNDSRRTAGCDEPEKGKGTVVYHNCDVPNISAEIIQDIVRFIIPTGAYGASQESAKTIAPSFGLPAGVLPGNGTVPVNESSRSYKYTGLELFGYNLRYTAYLGEWDYIKVFTKARAMSNFGVFDNLKLGGSAIIDGAVGAAQNSVEGWTSGWDSGGLAGAIGGFFSGAFEGAAAGGIQTILDTSDLNVFEQQAWYRPDFGATTYGARSLNSAELSAESLNWMNSMMNFFEPNTAVIPPDFPSRTPPPRPLEAISSCDVISNSSGATVAWGQRSTPPGVTEDQCSTEGNRIKADLQSAANAAAGPGETATTITAPAYVFDAEGAQPQESIAAWSSKNSGFIAGMNKYGWSCSLPAEGSASSRAAGIDGWYSCFSASYDENYKVALDAEKVKENNKYTESIFGQFAGVFAGWYAAQNQDKNFNAAYNRFVCVDPNTGDTMMAGGKAARVYNSDGSLTGNCAAIRAPIQDGFFGNGYNNTRAVTDQAEPIFDTRRAAFDPLGSVATTFGNTAAGMALGVSVLATQLSNTVLGLAFTPVLDALGIRDLIVSLIESFRDSMFMPLATLLAALGALTIFWRALRSNAYTEAFTSFLYIVIAFLLSVVILAKPAETLRVVDEAPVVVENTILTAMFGPDGSSDALCTATGSASGTAAGGTQIDGSSGFNPNASIRMLMCENWRSFAFTPWVHGQWGTGFENLYANGYAPSGSSALTNTNGNLVGNAGVNFGGGQIIHNWATYQLAVMTVGTSTTADPERPTGVVNKNFYRIVDAQMGPNGGAGTDPTYAESWSKFNGDTAVAMLLGPIAGIMGAFVVISYSIAKLGLVLLSVFLLVILPIMLLIGIQPTFGRSKLKAYGGTLLGLMIQRILLTVLIGLLFKFMFAISGSGANYFVVALVSIVIAAIFIAYRKELLGMVQRAMDAAAGSFAGGAIYNARQKIAQQIPPSIRNYGAMRKEEAKGVAFGLVAAAGHGQKIWEVPATVKSIRDTYRQREGAAQLVSGLGGSQKARQISDKIESGLKSKFNRSAEFEDSREALLGKAEPDNFFDDNGDLMKKTYETRDIDKLDVDADGNYVENGKIINVDGEGRVLNDRGIPVELQSEPQKKAFGRTKSLNSGAVRRSMAHQNRLREKMAKLEESKTVRIQKAETRALKRMGYGDIDQLSGEDRIEAQAARAQIHVNLTRYGKRDGRELAPDGSVIRPDARSVDVEFQSRPGDRHNSRVDAAEKALEDAVAAGERSGRFVTTENKKAAISEAYSELKDLIDKAIDDAKNPKSP